jgi:hypothetical protein
MTTEDPETFVIVTVCWALVVPTGTLPKSRAVGEIKNWLVPVPVNAIWKAWPFQVPLVLPVTGPTAVGVKA